MYSQQISKSMKTHLYLMLSTIVLILSACTSSQASMSPIHVEGNQFVNAEGDTIVFRGLCLSDPVKMIAHDSVWGEQIFAEAADWGANIVRFAVHPQNINSYGWEETFAAMDNGIAWAKKNGLYVIMDWHSIGNLKEERFTRPMYNTTWEETLRFWRTAAIRYKDEPTVALFELFNEPTYTASDVDLGEITWEEWRDMQEIIIDTIRTYHPTVTCLAAGFNWAYDLTPVAAAPIRRENIAYVCHPYPMKRTQPWEEKWEEDFGYVADTYPVICTEIGYCLEGERGAHIPVISTDEYGETITRYFEGKGISFTVWCFDPHWGPMLISDWDFTPTTSGRFFKTYLQSKK